MGEGTTSTCEMAEGLKAGMPVGPLALTDDGYEVDGCIRRQTEKRFQQKPKVKPVP